LTEGDDMVVHVRAANTGDRSGKTVLQLYLERATPTAVDRPVRWLAGFAAISADSGESIEVDIPLAPRAFEHWDGAWSTEPGDYLVRVGFSVVDLHANIAVNVGSGLASDTVAGAVTTEEAWT
jgi:beta-glucosidase